MNYAGLLFITAGVLFVLIGIAIEHGFIERYNYARRLFGANRWLAFLSALVDVIFY